MKIALYSPYLDTFGGGERYFWTVGSHWASKGHQVDVLLDKHLQTLDCESIRQTSQDRFGLDLSNINFVKAPFGQGANDLARVLFLCRYQAVFYLSDGSIFFSPAGKSILHFQVPFGKSQATDFFGKIKLASWKQVVVNSNFTKNIIDLVWGVKSKVIYPPVTQQSQIHQKNKIILSIGRFTNLLNSKKQDILVDVFIKMCQSGFSGWKLQVAGAKQDEHFLQELKRKSQGFPVEFFVDISQQELVSLKNKATIFWHAAGFGETSPERQEHFGIAVAEAMAAGCIPIVYKGGGVPEIIDHGQNGFLWQDTEELSNYTRMITSDHALAEKISQAASEKVRIFSQNRFEREIDELIT
ncbi:glycosyltransferase family 4 protein [Candidatus Daviesbacteria bacterium]|nr:glycosyltransferase family 4 protein [Candidatus Daviesbacteria bacterium]